MPTGIAERLGIEFPIFPFSHCCGELATYFVGQAWG
jgi:hypothetical protein